MVYVGDEEYVVGCVVQCVYEGLVVDVVVIFLVQVYEDCVCVGECFCIVFEYLYVWVLYWDYFVEVWIEFQLCCGQFECECYCDVQQYQQLVLVDDCVGVVFDECGEV